MPHKVCSDCGATGGEDKTFCGKCGGKMRYPKTGMARFTTPLFIAGGLIVVIVLHFMLDR